MKRINITLFTLMLLGILFSCTKASINYTQNGNWVGRATFPGSVMGFGVSFVIGHSAWVGTGINPQYPNSRLTTFYKYNPTPLPNPLPTPTYYDSTLGTWSRSADFGGPARSNAVAFTIGGLAYVGTGVANDGFTPLADFWSYNPTSNSWTQIDSIHQGSTSYPRLDAAAWGFDSVGYVLTGTDNYNYFLDIWKYSPTTGHWTSKPYLPGNPRSGATTWVYGGKGYIMAGYTPGSTHSSNNYAYDFWVFDPHKAETDTLHCWGQLRDIFNTSPATYDDGYTNIVRKYGNGFVVLASSGNNTTDKAYITLGQNGSAVSYTWEYDFPTDLWTEKTPYEGAPRIGAVGFTVDGRGFVGTGVSQGNQGAFQDLREFFPLQVYNQYD